MNVLLLLMFGVISIAKTQEQGCYIEDCQNDGICVPDVCVCRGKFYGIRCENSVQDIDCEKSNPCQNSGKCVDDKCICDACYDGSICQNKKWSDPDC